MSVSYGGPARGHRSCDAVAPGLGPPPSWSASAARGPTAASLKFNSNFLRLTPPAGHGPLSPSQSRWVRLQWLASSSLALATIEERFGASAVDNLNNTGTQDPDITRDGPGRASLNRSQSDSQSRSRWPAGPSHGQRDNSSQDSVPKQFCSSCWRLKPNARLSTSEFLSPPSKLLYRRDRGGQLIFAPCFSSIRLLGLKNLLGRLSCRISAPSSLGLSLSGTSTNIITVTQAHWQSTE